MASELALLASKHERIEAEDESDLITEEPSQPQASSTVAEPEAGAGADQAETVLKISEQVAKLFIDDRLFIPDKDVEDCRDSVGPMLDKYGLVVGEGKNPYQEEMAAGFWLGRFIKKSISAIRELRASDREQQKQEQQAGSNGNQREHQSTEQAQPVSGAERVREESDPDAPGWLG